MELETRHLVLGTLAALAVGGGYAWYIAQPERDRADDADRERASAEVAHSEIGATAADAPTLYKWKGDDGVWNYTDQPPPDREYTAISGTPNVNSVPTVVPETPYVEETVETGAEESE